MTLLYRYSEVNLFEIVRQVSQKFICQSTVHPMVACRQKSMRWFDIYTEVSEEEATRLLAAAGQAELRKMEPLAGGWANSTYLLTLDDDSQLVLKLWHNKTPIEVERIIRNTCWLADHGVPTPIPLLLKDGEEDACW